MGPDFSSSQFFLEPHPHWPQRSHVILPVRLGSHYTNQSILCFPPNISVKALRDRSSLHRPCPTVPLLRWLSLTEAWDSYSIFPRPISWKPMNLSFISNLVVCSLYNQSCLSGHFCYRPGCLTGQCLSLLDSRLIPGGHSS